MKLGIRQVPAQVVNFHPHPTWEFWQTWEFPKSGAAPKRANAETPNLGIGQTPEFRQTPKLGNRPDARIPPDPKLGPHPRQNCARPELPKCQTSAKPRNWATSGQTPNVGNRPKFGTPETGGLRHPRIGGFWGRPQNPGNREKVTFPGNPRNG
jgi:hypothetical protein